MTIRIFCILLLFQFIAGNLIAQNDSVYFSDGEIDKEPSREVIFKPTIGMGIGMFSFYGDISDKTLNHALVSKIGYDLNVGKPLTSFLDINFYILFGTLSSNERSPERNLNFQSEIRTGGAILSYNFDHLLRKERKVEPYFSVGIESFEFLSKTDLFDARGNKYFYWNDGSIRNMDQNNPLASEAVYLQRDYTFETDIRESNIDGFGKYTERSFAIPVGAGVKMKLSDKVNFKIGATMHYTFTDLVDGISAESVDNRAGNSKNDRFLMTSFSLSYDFMFTKKSKSKLNEEDFEEVDFLALEMADADGDGIRDFIDSCAGTPIGIPVDKYGCPLDDDNDGVPNYKDDELATVPNVFVTTEGVELTDSLILDLYRTYMDSTGQFAKVSKSKYEAEVTKKVTASKYSVQIGAYTTGIPPELINKFLSIPDIISTTVNDSVTVYTTGSYTDVAQAKKRKNDLLNSGISSAIVVLNKDGKFIPEGTAAFNSGGTTETKTTDGTTNDGATSDGKTNDGTTNDGATTDGKISDGTTNDSATNDGKTSDGTTNDGATNDGKTSDGTTNDGATTDGKTSNGKTTDVKTTDGPPPTFDTDPENTVVFRVQLGAYSKKLSNNVFSGVNDLVVITTDKGLVKYLTGSFTDFNDAAKYKVDLLLKGYNGAFIVAYKNGTRVPLQSVGATKAAPEDIKESSKTSNAINKDLITFKVQIGAFKNAVPVEIMEKFNAIQDIENQSTPTGLTRYTAGSFKSFDKATAYKKELIEKYGIDDAFIVAFFKDQIIPVQEALELAK